jgi:hypothetical protein
MESYKINDLTLILGSLIYCSRDLNTADQLSKKICTEEFLKQLAVCLDGLEILCNNFDADPSLLHQIQNLKHGILEGKTDRRESVLHAQLEAVLSGVQNNLSLRKFMYMTAEDASYWDNPKLFGDDFLDSFPKAAIVELREAGNCLAVWRGTACVFHCMRIAEHGLRKLAKKLRVQITDKGKKCPLEYGDWDKVITAIRNKIAAVRALPRGPRKEGQLQFYSEAADHCEYMKDIWRNELAHTRRIYNKQETLGVFHRVRDFSEFLAKHDAHKEGKKQHETINH